MGRVMKPVKLSAVELQKEEQGILHITYKGRLHTQHISSVANFALLMPYLKGAIL
jgi:hypothetical protein